MHNIKTIRSDSEIFKKKISERNVNADVEKLISLDKKNRELLQKKDEKLFVKSKNLSIEIDEITKSQQDFKKEIETILASIPNIALNEVPIGRDDTANKEIDKIGEIPKFDFKPASHYEIGSKLKLMDFESAVKTSGARFVFLKSKLAQLERAISNLMLDIHTKEFGYEEISPPLIVNESTMFGTGQLPKFEDDQFQLKIEEKSKKYLIPTAEVVLTNIVREKFIDKKDLPLRFVASTACFRKEAGSYGKDTKGMIRQHHFYKVELVSIVTPNECIKELDRMTNCAQEILKRLKLPFRKVLLSTGDMGFSAEKTFDLEVWIPSENKYREISSCSSCGQFQARRMKAKYKNEKNESDFVGTLNGSGLAVGRTLIAIMENYQQKDGSIIIPEVLRNYMNGDKKIE